MQYYAIDNKAGLKYTYTYDKNRKHATKVTVTNTAGGAQKYVKNISYDGYDRVTSENYGSAIYSRTVSYPDSNDSPQERLERVKHTVNGISASNTTYEYDGLNRVTKEKVGKSSSSSSLVFENRYEYYAGKSGTNETTGLVRKEEYYLKNITAPQGSIEYEYDANGNVTEIKNLLDTGKNVSYEYDSLNRLTKETNLAIGSEWRYTYDNGGNITKKEEYNPATGALRSSWNYGYGDTYWKDQLTSWGSYGTSYFAYDSSGNPTKYKGKTLEWEGKRLARYNESDMKYTDLSYDGNGLLAFIPEINAPLKVFNKSIPQKIVIENGIIEFSSDECNQYETAENVKCIFDFGDWYHIVFKFPTKSIYCVCQKDLLVQGTIEEFEAVFERKIVVHNFLNNKRFA